ncbi:hypothetical protein J4558_00050 [Leptolyngbya sp. 15MV]|nr:hypothetical protein J4558_00050 [Leptolyngbya sp. 15MV]
MCTETLKAIGSAFTDASPWLSIAGRGAAAGAQIAGGISANRTARVRANLLEAEAANLMAEGRVAEEITRERGERVVEAARANIGASGVVVDEGSPLEVLADSFANLERDALNLRYRYLAQANNARNLAAFERQAGRAALFQGIGAGAGTVLGTFGTEAWKRITNPAAELNPGAQQQPRPRIGPAEIRP